MGLRFVACDAFINTCKAPSVQTKLEFLRNPMNLLDLLAILPFYLEVVLALGVRPLRVLRSVRLLRCFRVFKFNRYYEGMQLMIGALNNSMRSLTILVLFLCIGVILFSSLLYFAERSYCPDVSHLKDTGEWPSYRVECADGARRTSDGLLCCNEHGSAAGFESIAQTLWWSIVTTTTVGYGDRVPETPLGRAVACLAMLSGIVLISLPVAIVGTKFQRAYHDYVEHERLLEEEAREQKRASRQRHATMQHSQTFVNAVRAVGVQKAMQPKP